MWVFQSHEPYIDRLGKKDYGVATHVRYGYWKLGNQPLALTNRAFGQAQTYAGRPLHLQTGQFLHESAEFPEGAKRVAPQFGVPGAPVEVKNARPPVLIDKMNKFKDPFLRNATFVFWKMSLREMRIASNDNNLYNIMHMVSNGVPVADVPASKTGRVISGKLIALDDRKPILDQMMRLFTTEDGKALRDRFRANKEAHLAAAGGLLEQAHGPKPDPQGVFQKLTSADGKFTVDARIVAYAGGNAKLEKRDGKTVQVPIGKFDKDSQDVIRAWIRAQKAPANEPVVGAAKPANPAVQDPMPAPKPKLSQKELLRQRIEAMVTAGRITREQADAKLRGLGPSKPPSE